MAKSGRSKIKRANRAIKREKNSKKELAKLEKMVELAQETAGTHSEKKAYTVLGGSTADPPAVQEEAMVVDGEAPKPDASTIKEDGEEELPMGVGARKANGNFPVWMHNRAIKRAKAVEKKKAKQKKKGMRAGSRPWRK